MPNIQIDAELSENDLLEAVAQLGPSELDHFIEQVHVLKAQRRVPRLSHAESELLLKINNPIPEELHQRYHDLIEKRDAETLTDEEYEELLALTDQVELLEAARVEHLIALADLRQVTPRELMKSLGIGPNIDG